MKKVSTLIPLLILTLTTYSQVSITVEDYTQKGQLGDTLSYLEAGSVTVDIGQLGETSWDFSNVSMERKTFVEFVDPSTTPFVEHYPNSTSVVHQVISGDFPSDIYGYTAVTDSSVLYFGESISDNSGEIHIMFNPMRELFFPLNYESLWTYEGTETFVFGGTPDSNPLTVINNVNSYGELTLPSGKTIDALLMRSYEIREFDGTLDTLKTFTFYTKDADIIVMFLFYGEPDTGEILISDLIWYENTVSEVGSTEKIANEFRLVQNYPNPFNPFTIIEFSLPEANNVELKIFDSLGREVIKLINEFRPAGNYKTEFNSAGLASGTYFARLESGEFSKSIKLTLLK